VTISSYATKVAFCFHSDGSVGSGPYEGVYVDDVLLTFFDSRAPTSSIEPLPPYAKISDVTLNCIVADNGGSGFNNIQIHYRKGTTGPYTLYTTNSNPTGVWTSKSIDFKFADAGGSEGVYQFYSIATDNAGNVEATPASYEASIILDITPPVTTAAYNGALTPSWNNHSLTITLSAIDGYSGVSKTYYRLDGGAWTPYSKPVIISGQGGHVMKYNSTDNAGNVETAKSISFNIDTIAPALSITTPNDRSSSNTGSMTVQWTSSDGGSGIAKTEISLDRAIWTTVSGTSNSFGGLSDGPHTIDVRVTDNAGNVKMASVTFDVDTVAPSVTITLPADGLHTNASSVPINWTALDNTTGVAYIHVWNDTDPFVNMTSGDWYEFTGLSEGSHALHVMAWDMVGNSQEKTVSVVVDRTAPEIAITNPQWGQRVNDTVINATWTAFDNLSPIVKIEVAVDDGIFSEVGVSMFHHFAGIREGEHTIYVRATDSAGNTAVQHSLFTVERTAPTVIDHLPSDGAIVLLDPVIRVTFSEAMNQSSVTFTGIAGTKTWNPAGTEVNLTHLSLAYATTYDITVSGKDLVGNALTGPNLTWSFTVITQVIGTVEDLKGNPVADATVALAQGTVLVDGLTDSNGHFGLIVNGGTYNLTISKSGFQDLAVNNKTFGVGQNNTMSTLVMTFVVPGAPTGLTAISGNSQVTLNWTAPSMIGGSGIDYFVIYRDGIALSGHQIGLTSVVAGLSNGHEYDFTVAAHNLAGTGAPSNVVSSIPWTFPGAPIEIRAVVNNSQVSLNWSAPNSNGGSPIINYQVYRSTNETGSYSLIASPSGQTYNDTELAKGQTYWYKVSAVSALGEGANSPATSALVPQITSPAEDATMLIMITVIAVAAVLAASLLVLRKRKDKV
jgi:hypothetical protein